MRNRSAPILNNPTTEADVVLGLACGDLSMMFDTLVESDFYDLRHRYLFRALRTLHDRSQLERRVEVRVAGRRVDDVREAFGHPSVWVGFTVVGIREALLEAGAPNVRGIVRHLEGLFVSNVPADEAAVLHLRQLADARARVAALDAERGEIMRRWAS